MAGLVDAEEFMKQATAPKAGGGVPAGVELVDPEEGMGEFYTPSVSFTDRAKTALYRSNAIMDRAVRGESPRYGRDHMTTPAKPGLDALGQLDQEGKAAVNMFVGLPGGVASVGMDALSRFNSLFAGDSPKVAGQKARAVADQVNTDWHHITQKLGLTRDSTGSHIDALMQWGMEASDAGGSKLETATKGVLSLETTQSVRDALLNLLGVRGTAAMRPKGTRPSASGATLTAQEAIDASKARIAARTDPEAKLADLPEATIVDEARLRQIMGLEKPDAAVKLTKAEVAVQAEVKAFFDKALKPEKKQSAVVRASLEDIDASIEKLRAGSALTPDETAGVQQLKLNREAGTIEMPDGTPVLQRGRPDYSPQWGKYMRGRADPALLKTLGIMGLGGVAAAAVANWFNSGDVSGDTLRDVGLAGAAALGVATLGKGPRRGLRMAQRGAIKPPGGMWHPKAVETLTEPLRRAATGGTVDLSFDKALVAGRLNDELRRPFTAEEFKEAWSKTAKGALEIWSTNAVTKYLNRFAGTARDPIKDLRLPDGTKWEELADSALGGKTVKELREQGIKEQGYAPDEFRNAPETETVWMAGRQSNVFSPKEQARQVSLNNITSYLSHVGEFLRSLNLPPEKLQQYDLPRAIRETVANDVRVQKLAMEEFTKPQPFRIADMQSMPLYKIYPTVREPARQFNFHNDKSTTHKSVESAPLPAEDIAYQWRELALPKELTAEQMRRVVPVKELPDAVFQEITRGKTEVGQFIALDAKGKPLKNNFSATHETGTTPQEAFLAGRLAENGNQLGHCVGGYCGQVLSGESRILTLVDQNARPYATVELEPFGADTTTAAQLKAWQDAGSPEFAIAQIKGPGNGAAADYVKPAILDFLNSNAWELTQQGLKDIRMQGLEKYKDKYMTKAEYEAQYTADSAKERGAARPEHLAAIAAGTAAAAYFASEGSPEALQNLALAGLAAGSLKAVKGKAETDLISTYRRGTQVPVAPKRLVVVGVGKGYEHQMEWIERALKRHNLPENLPIEHFDMKSFPEKGDVLEAIQPGDVIVGSHLSFKAKGDAPDYFYNKNNDKLIETAHAKGSSVLLLGEQPDGVNVPSGKLYTPIKVSRAEANAAFAKLYTDNIKQLERSITQLGKDLPAEDLAQEVMTKAAIGLAKAPDEPGGFRGGSKLSTWLHTIATNQVHKHWEREKPARGTDSLTKAAEGFDDEGLRPMEEADVVDPNKPPTSSESVALNNELAQRMESALQKLNPVHRAVFEAKELEGLDYQQIADQLNIPIGTVRSRLSAARDALQASLRDYRAKDGTIWTSESGKVNYGLMAAVAGIGAGALAGAAIAQFIDPKHPLRDAIYGGLVGAAFSTGIGRKILKQATTEPGMALGGMATELAELHPSLGFKQRRHEMRVLQRTEQANDAVLPFLKDLKKLPKDSPIIRALLNRDAAMVHTHPELSKSYPAVQRLLKTLETELKALGRFGEGLINYFPRIVKDWEGMKAAMKKPAATGLEAALIEAEAKMVRKEQRSTTEVEQSLVANRYLNKLDETSFLPGYAKSRKFDEIPVGFEKFYEPPETSLLRYISSAIKDIETAKYFGKDLTTKKSGKKIYTDVDGSIGNLTARLMRDAKLKREGAMKLREILKSRFEGGERGMNQALATVRNLTNAALLGNFVSAATQVGDSVFIVFHQGFVPTVQAIAERAIGRAKITPKQLGLINHVAEELADTSTSVKSLFDKNADVKTAANWAQSVSGKYLRGTLMLSAFKNIDLFAKGTGLNAALIRHSQEMNGVLRSYHQARFKKKYGPAFEEPGQLDQVIADLRARRITPDTEFVAFNELSNMQPISKAEVPPMFNKHPNGRMLYQLKTYMIKQADIVRTQAWHEMREGTLAGITRGTKNLTLLGFMYALANVPGDVIKDWMSGRDSDPLATPKLMENVLQTFGLNRYATEKLSQGKVVETARDTVTPPWKVIEDIAEGKPEAMRYVPIAGRIYYDRYMGGNEKREKTQARIDARATREARDNANGPQKPAKKFKKAKPQGALQ